MNSNDIFNLAVNLTQAYAQGMKQGEALSPPQKVEELQDLLDDIYDAWDGQPSHALEACKQIRTLLDLAVKDRLFKHSCTYGGKNHE